MPILITSVPHLEAFCHTLGLPDEQWQDICSNPLPTENEDIRRTKARQVLYQLWLVYSSVDQQQNLNVYTLRHWMLWLIQLADLTGSLQLDKLLMPKTSHLAHRCIQAINKAMRPVSVVLPVAVMALSIGVMANTGAIPEQTVANNVSQLSCMADFPAVIQQWAGGERAISSLNAIDVLGSATCGTLLSAKVYTNALTFSAGVNFALMGLNIAFSSLTCVTESLSWHKSHRNGQRLDASLVRMQQNGALPSQKIVQKIAVLEKAKCADHKRNTGVHVGLLALSIATTVTLSVVSFGTPLVMALAALVVNAVIFAVKMYNTFKTQHVALALKSLQSQDQSLPLVDRLHAVLDKKPWQLDFQKNITITHATFFKKNLSLKAYLESLLHRNPGKLTDIVTALEQSNRSAFEKALQTHQQACRYGDTLGMQLYRQLQLKVVSNNKVIQENNVAPCAA